MPDSLVPVPVSAPTTVSVHDLLPEDEDLTLHARAAGRTLAGLALGVGAIAVAAAAFVGDMGARSVFIGAWAVAAAFLLGARLVGPRLARALVSERATPEHPAFARSWALFSAGLMLILPLTVHFAFTGFEGGEEFDRWVALSVVVVGHVHLVLAAIAARRATRLAASERALPIGGAYAITAISSLFPGMFFLFLPTVIVGVTGLAILPVLALLEARITNERIERIGRVARGAA